MCVIVNMCEREVAAVRVDGALFEKLKHNFADVPGVGKDGDGGLGVPCVRGVELFLQITQISISYPARPLKMVSRSLEETYRWSRTWRAYFHIVAIILLRIAIIISILRPQKTKVDHLCGLICWIEIRSAVAEDHVGELDVRVDQRGPRSAHKQGTVPRVLIELRRPIAARAPAGMLYVQSLCQSPKDEPEHGFRELSWNSLRVSNQVP